MMAKGTCAAGLHFASSAGDSEFLHPRLLHGFALLFGDGDGASPCLPDTIVLLGVEPLRVDWLTGISRNFFAVTDSASTCLCTLPPGRAVNLFGEIHWYSRTRAAQRSAMDHGYPPPC